MKKNITDLKIGNVSFNIKNSAALTEAQFIEQHTGLYEGQSTATVQATLSAAYQQIIAAANPASPVAAAAPAASAATKAAAPAPVVPPVAAAGANADAK